MNIVLSIFERSMGHNLTTLFGKLYPVLNGFSHTDHSLIPLFLFILLGDLLPYHPPAGVQRDYYH